MTQHRESDTSIGIIIVMVVLLAAFSLSVILAVKKSMEVGRLRSVELAHIAQAHKQRERINGLCDIVENQGSLLSMNMPGDEIRWRPNVSELCK
jgi:hypothetical protein